MTPVSSAPGSETQPLWRLYLLAVSSLCLYLPFWVYRRARLNGEGKEFGSSPIWWALGSFVVPVCCAVLYDFSTRATIGGSDARARLWHALPSLLLAALLLATFMLGWGTHMVTPYLLLPIPFLIVQRRINAGVAATVAASTATAVPMRFRLWILIGLGLPAMLAAWWLGDFPELVQLSIRPMDSQTKVVSTFGRYEITTPDGQWKRVEVGTVSDGGSEIELVGPGAFTWLVMFRDETPGSSIDSTITARRELVSAYGELVTVHEERFFLEGSDLVPVSLAYYQVEFGVGLEDYVALTADFDSEIVEILTHADETDAYRAELAAFVLSLRQTQDEREP